MSVNPPGRDSADDIKTAFHVYPLMPERIRGLEIERARIIKGLMPKYGASLVQVSRRSGGAVSDPTGRAAVRIEGHPFIKKLGGLIAYWRQRQEKVERVLQQLTEAERQVVDVYFFADVDVDEKDQTISWKMIREMKAETIKKIVRLWNEC